MKGRGPDFCFWGLRAGRFYPPLFWPLATDYFQRYHSFPLSPHKFLSNNSSKEREGNTLRVLELMAGKAISAFVGK